MWKRIQIKYENIFQQKNEKKLKQKLKKIETKKWKKRKKNSPWALSRIWCFKLQAPTYTW